MHVFLLLASYRLRENAVLSQLLYRAIKQATRLIMTLLCKQKQHYNMQYFQEKIKRKYKDIYSCCGSNLSSVHIMQGEEYLPAFT